MGNPGPLRQSAVIAVSMVQRAGFLGFWAGEKVPSCFFIGIDATGWSRRFFRLAARGGRCLLFSRKAWPPARLDKPKRQPDLGADGLGFCDRHSGRRSFLSGNPDRCIRRQRHNRGNFRNVGRDCGRQYAGRCGGWLPDREVVRWCAGFCNSRANCKVRNCLRWFADHAQRYNRRCHALSGRVCR